MAKKPPDSKAKRSPRKPKTAVEPSSVSPTANLEAAIDALVAFHGRQAALAAPSKAAPSKAAALVGNERKILEANLQKELAIVRAAAKPDPPPVDIVDFFSRISSGMVTAQRNLDDQSREYLKTSAAQPHAMPSIFRIPKVTAEMKVAVDTTTTKGLNLLFYQDQTKAEQLHQQTVKFDIVSAPPPPDYVSPWASAAMVRLKSDREDVRKQTGPPSGVDDFDRVLIVEIIDPLQGAPAADATRQFLIVFAKPGGDLGVWWLQVKSKDGTPVSFQVVRPLGPPGTPLQAMRDYFAAAGDRQKAFLAKLP